MSSSALLLSFMALVGSHLHCMERFYYHYLLCQASVVSQSAGGRGDVNSDLWCM